MNIKIELPDDADETTTLLFLEQLVKEMNEGTLEAKELMDGSFPIGSLGQVAFVSFNTDEN